MVDLNTKVNNATGWNLKEARAINNQGQIVAWGYNPDSGYEAVLLTPAPPTIGCSLTYLDFSVYEGIESTYISPWIWETGGGTMSWTASDDQDWIYVSPSSGTVQNGQLNRFNVYVNTIGKALNTTYTGNVTITAEGATNSPLVLPVQMIITPYPKIAYSPALFTFTGAAGGVNPADQTLSISNSQGGTLNWYVSSGASWLTLSPTSGTQSGTVTLSVNTASLAAGSYAANITIEGNAVNNPVTVPVTLDITVPAPAIGFSPASLSWNLWEGSATGSMQQLNVTNTGGGTMTWTATPDQAWIRVGPQTNTTSFVYVWVDAAGKAAGAYNGNVVITASGATNSPQYVPVTMTITQQVTITYPNGGETLRSGQTVTITWTANPSQTVSKTETYYSTDAGATWKLIKAQNGIKLNVAWRVPSLKNPSSQCLVKTQFKDSKGVVFAQDVSNGYFTITK